ncbi:MAG: hypothetical protein HPY50_02365 [Firmicutes bacterium]|nr:hypothetical protein [Bacillota bacterium]
MKTLFKKMALGTTFVGIFVLISAIPVFGATFTYTIGSFQTSGNSVSPISAVGYNKTHGFTMSLPCSVRFSGSGSRPAYFDYTLPDDGSTWVVTGTWAVCTNYSDGIGAMQPTYIGYGSFTETKTTTGTFTGVSIQQAVSAAQQAKTSADEAVENTNIIIDDLLSESGNLVQDSEGTAIEGIRNLQSTVNNISNNISNNIVPNIDSINGVNGATCTTGNEFTLVISANPSSDVTYRVQCGSFDSGWVTGNTITITDLSVTGAYQALCQVKHDSSGMTAQKDFTFFKI